MISVASAATMLSSNVACAALSAKANGQQSIGKAKADNLVLSGGKQPAG
ncbi:hypothetical protein [Amycolatopsis sp. cmx-11-12]